MMGPRQVDEAALFYEFSLERHVPATHLLGMESIPSSICQTFGAIWRHFTNLPVGLRLIPNCSSGYFAGRLLLTKWRSERRLCEEVPPEPRLPPFCRLGLDGEVPDHSTFSKNRHGRFHRGTRSAAKAVRDRGPALHGGRRAGRRGRFCGRCQPDCRRMPTSSALLPGLTMLTEEAIARTPRSVREYHRHPG